MNRRNTLALGTAALLCVQLSLPTGGAVAQQSDTDKVKATVDNFHAALTALDINKMDDVWAHEPYVTVVNPRDKSISVGWDAVKQAFQAGVFNFWSELKVTPRDAPTIHVNGNVAWVNGVTVAAGKPKSGGDVSAPTFETGILEKRGDRWLIVSWSAWRIPQ
jgi:ketosteroid isomerase-like protein